MSSSRTVFLRDFEAHAHFELFLVSAVSAVLGIRLFLHLSGYPAVGGDTLHVAHILWGGVLMLAAIVVSLSFVGRTPDRIAAVVGGVGFGTFIDEVGKFVTREHDYFYEPAVALIYVSFVLVFLAFRTIHERRAYTDEEHLVNALAELEELALLDLDPEEKRRVLERLDRSDPDHPLVRALRPAVAAIDPHVEIARSLRGRARETVRTLYRRMTRLPGFDLALIVFFVGQLAVKVVYGALLIFVVGLGGSEVLDARFVGRAAERMQHLSGLEIAQLAASALSGVFVALGVIRLKRSRFAAYLMFERAVLVSILLVQVFSFYQEQFAALVELVFNLLVLVGLRSMIAIEEERATARAGGAAAR